jgi:hypothetical protein
VDLPLGCLERDGGGHSVWGGKDATIFIFVLFISYQNISIYPDVAKEMGEDKALLRSIQIICCIKPHI